MNYIESTLLNVAASELTLIIYIIIGGVILLAAAVSICFFVMEKKKNEYVSEKSPYLREIRGINDKYDFYELRGYDSVKVRLDSLKRFRSFNPDQKRKEYINKYKEYYSDLVEKMEFNLRKFAEYQEEIDAVCHTNNEELAKEGKMKLDDFVSRETIIKNEITKKISTNYQLKIHYEYTSPAGRNHYSDSRNYSYCQIKADVIGTSDINKKADDAIRNQREKAYSSDDIEDVE